MAFTRSLSGSHFFFALTDAAGVINCSPEKKRRTLIGLCLAFCGGSIEKMLCENEKKSGLLSSILGGIFSTIQVKEVE